MSATTAFNKALHPTASNGRFIEAGRTDPGTDVVAGDRHNPPVCDVPDWETERLTEDADMFVARAEQFRDNGAALEAFETFTSLPAARIDTLGRDLGTAALAAHWMDTFGGDAAWSAEDYDNTHPTSPNLLRVDISKPEFTFDGGGAVPSHDWELIAASNAEAWRAHRIQLWRDADREDREVRPAA